MLRKERKERRKEARKKKAKFAPEYNGTQVKTFEEFYGTGNERFNNKFITIKEIDEQKENNE